MQMKYVSAGYEPSKVPYGKVIGIADNHAQLDQISAAVEKLGVKEMEVIDGAAGKAFLDSEYDVVFQYFLGDMEAKTILHYRNAVSHRHLIFAALVEAENAQPVAEAAKALGATEVVHFGEWVVTNY